MEGGVPFPARSMEVEERAIHFHVHSGEIGWLKPDLFLDTAADSLGVSWSVYHLL